jgi:carbon-monoxide dehydrogenase small subunit
MSAIARNGHEGRSNVHLSLVVNGEPIEVEVAARDTLAWVLREKLGLTGTKIGCDMQVCGACAVLVDGEVVSACTVLAWQVDNRAVTTIEGVAESGELHPVQRSFIAHGGMQCGFCTPGMVMTTLALLEEKPSPTAAEIKEYLAGNLCRCTGYQSIVNSVLDAVAEGGGR